MLPKSEPRPEAYARMMSKGLLDLSTERNKAVVLALREATPSLSYKSVADRTGATPHHVRMVAYQLRASGEALPLRPRSARPGAEEKPPRGKAITINVNDQVLLRVTESGWRAYDEYWKPYQPPSLAGYRPPLLPDGRVKMQLHEVMLVFGSRMQMGNMDLPFGTEMELVR